MATTNCHVATTASDVSRKLRELAYALDSSTSQPEVVRVATALQALAKQLLEPPKPIDTAAAAEATAAAASLAALPAAAATTETVEVEALERSYAAPAAQPAVQPKQPDEQPNKKKQRRDKVFDFSRFSQRYVALHVMYVGWSYQGFARQADSENTIEGVLFPALRKTKLIPDDAEIASLSYSRCGRTDKGVSALGQVLALKLRSAGAAGAALPPAAAELDYPSLINRALPETIRVLGWADVGEEFSARFSASHREYKYFIVQDGSLDVAAMAAAAGHLVGEHDFRNFCKADVSQVRNFKRVVLGASLEPARASCEGMSVLALHIRGTAFLWHQIRCIASVLLMVGRGQEQPSIVQQLLDTTRVPCKPQYAMAAEEPLLLYHCGFQQDQEVNWRRSEQVIDRNLAAVGKQVQQHLVAAALMSSIFEQLQRQRSQLTAGADQQQQQQQEEEEIAGVPNSSSSSCSRSSRWLPKLLPHIPLLRRQTEPSMEERFEKAGISIELLNQPGGVRDMEVE